MKSLCVPAPADGCRPRVGRAATPARAWGLSIHVHVITRLRLVAHRPPVSPMYVQALNKCEKILICQIVARPIIPAISPVHVERTLLTSIFFRTYRPGPWREGAITSNRDVCMQSRGALTDGTRRYRAAAITPPPSQRPWTRIAPSARARITPTETSASILPRSSSLSHGSRRQVEKANVTKLATNPSRRSSCVSVRTT